MGEWPKYIGVYSKPDKIWYEIVFCGWGAPFHKFEPMLWFKYRDHVGDGMAFPPLAMSVDEMMRCARRFRLGYLHYMGVGKEKGCRRMSMAMRDSAVNKFRQEPLMPESFMELRVMRSKKSEGRLFKMRHNLKLHLRAGYITYYVFLDYILVGEG